LVFPDGSVDKVRQGHQVVLGDVLGDAVEGPGEGSATSAEVETEGNSNEESSESDNDDDEFLADESGEKTTSEETSKKTIIRLLSGGGCWGVLSDGVVVVVISLVTNRGGGWGSIAVLGLDRGLGSTIGVLLDWRSRGRSIFIRSRGGLGSSIAVLSGSGVGGRGRSSCGGGVDWSGLALLGHVGRSDGRLVTETSSGQEEDCDDGSHHDGSVTVKLLLVVGEEYHYDITVEVLTDDVVDLCSDVADWCLYLCEAGL